MLRWLMGAMAALAVVPPGATASAGERLAVPILYLERQVERPPTLSNLDPVPDDEGLAGARLGLADNATTGRFLKHDYVLDERVVAPGEEFLAAARAALAAGARLLVVNAPAADLLALADLPEAARALILNGAAPDDRLRRGDCRANLLHAIPSRAMLADALAEHLVTRRWTKWFLIEGEAPGDTAYAEAIRRSAAKFGARIVAEKVWRFDSDMRRNAAQEVPLFTQGPDHDVLIVADEAGDFGRYIPYNTWLPRPVAGTEGLSPQAWGPAVEQWGAAQLQSRFEALAGRKMRAVDYGVWAAVRTIGEAVTRTGSADVGVLRDYILSDAFELGGFKGRKMSYRPWNGQLRQPIPLIHPHALAAQAPLPGFLHQRTELDTLGYDAPEAGCTAFAR